ncbi:unnamed protein product [Nezara viridula]|uniref:Uncharacterized protein n=1 Tax=Nezara viridula TaxID=85310 RepID=A0A9P0HPQ8_NEZVI|nr:unnamed protein product [Nezara viridula]
MRAICFGKVTHRPDVERMLRRATIQSGEPQGRRVVWLGIEQGTDIIAQEQISVLLGLYAEQSIKGFDFHELIAKSPVYHPPTTGKLGIRPF